MNNENMQVTSGGRMRHPNDNLSYRDFVNLCERSRGGYKILWKDVYIVWGVIGSLAFIFSMMIWHNQYLINMTSK